MYTRAAIVDDAALRPDPPPATFGGLAPESAEAAEQQSGRRPERPHSRLMASARRAPRGSIAARGSVTCASTRKKAANMRPFSFRRAEGEAVRRQLGTALEESGAEAEQPLVSDAVHTLGEGCAGSIVGMRTLVSMNTDADDFPVWIYGDDDVTSKREALGERVTRATRDCEDEIAIRVDVAAVGPDVTVGERVPVDVRVRHDEVENREFDVSVSCATELLAFQPPRDVAPLCQARVRRS